MLTGAEDRQLHWTEAGRSRSATLLSGEPNPYTQIQVIDDTMRADQALRLARRGTGLLWRGDYHNARQLLRSLRTRLDRQSSRARDGSRGDLTTAYAQQRQEQFERAQVLGAVIVELSPSFAVAAGRAPDVSVACSLAYGARDHATLVSLPELLGIIGAAQWRLRGMIIPALAAAIYPHYGVFGPTRLDYVDLFATMPLPSTTRPLPSTTRPLPSTTRPLPSTTRPLPSTTRPLLSTTTAFDIGTGTGVLSAILARRGISQILATDIESRATACASDNIERLGFTDQVTVRHTDLFPDGRANLIVCNPPWLPGTPTSTLERGVYDRDGAMLAGFIEQLPDHLSANGEAWLVLSDLAERLGLRDPTFLDTMINKAGLVMDGSHATQPRIPSASDDPLTAARASEIITVWRLRPA